jgi:hypothetical protein
MEVTVALQIDIAGQPHVGGVDLLHPLFGVFGVLCDPRFTSTCKVARYPSRPVPS